MIKKILIFALFTSFPPTSLLASQSAFLAVNRPEENEEKLVTYPQDVYPWYETIRRFPPDLQRKFLHYQLCTTLEPSVCFEEKKRKNCFEERRNESILSLGKVVFSNNSQYLVLGFSPQGTYLLNLETIECHKILESTYRVEAIIFSPDDSKLALIEGGAFIHFIDKDHFRPTGEMVDAAYRRTEGTPFLENERSGGCMIMHRHAFFTPENDLLIVDNHRNIYRFNAKTKRTTILTSMECTKPTNCTDSCDNQIEYCNTPDSVNLIAISRICDLACPITLVTQFNTQTCQWSEPLGNRTFHNRSGHFCDLQGNWLTISENLINLQSKECRIWHPEMQSMDCSDLAVRDWLYTKFSPDARFIVTCGEHDPFYSIYHRNSGAVIARGKMWDPCNHFFQGFLFSNTFIGVYGFGGMALYPVKLLWKYHASFQEGLVSFDIVMFVKFLDDLFQEGLILKESRLVINDSPLVKIVAEGKLDPEKYLEPRDTRYTLRYTVLLRKPHAYKILRKAGLKIIAAEVQKVEGIQGKSPKQLSPATITNLRALWNSLSTEARDELFQEYGTSF